MILRRAEAMARESEELLATVRAEAMPATHPRRVLLRTRLQYTASSFGCGAASHPVTVDVSGSPVAWVDPGVLDQVLENLVENAVKYSPAGGTIELRASASPGHTDCVIEVIDQGVGIPLDVDIFAPFARGSAADTDIVGSGLGLHVVATLVRSMNGSVNAQRNVDAGSTFTLRLPRHQPRLPTEGSL
jgi:signal transduction histidine kinase